MRRLSFFILLFTFICVLAIHAATYNYYFSMSGGGSTCSEVSPCKWVSSDQVGYTSGTTADDKIDAANSDDTVNLYFNRGDTWSFNTDAVTTTRSYGLQIGTDDPIVNVDAYGAGNKPKFDGTVTDFSTVPEHNITTGPLKWNNIFEMERSGCSFRNIHIDGIYGSGFHVPASYAVDNIMIEAVDVTNYGGSAFTSSLDYGTQNSTITKSLFHTGQQLFKNRKSGCDNCWGGAFTFAPWSNVKRSSLGNTASYNVIYDIYGEGIHGYGYTAEYNIVGDTGSYGIYICPSKSDATNTIIRYNFVMQSSSGDYKNHPVASYHGIVVADEKAGGDNTSATVEIYGNIVINRNVGIMFNNYNGTTAWGEVRIFNNTIIDSYTWNMYMNHGEFANAGYWYNNASILYDRTGNKHANDQYLSNISNWTIENNHFWTKGGSPTVDADWRTNYVTTDPKLYGEEKGSPVDWVGQTTVTYYYKDITFADVTPNSGSGLINTGKIIPFEDTFLSNGSDFSVLPTTPTFVTKQQSHDGKWDIGAIIFSESTESKATLKAPVGLDVGKKNK